MQTTSATWKALWAAGAAWLETRATIAGTVYTQMSNPVITRALTQSGMNIGNAVSATCQVSILTGNAIPRAAAVVIEQRLNDGTTASEWLPAGTFYISRRTRDAVTGLLNLECYDTLLKANAIWEPASSTTWPQTMGDVATALAALLGVALDSRTSIKTGAAYVIEKPDAGTTIHDVLGRIAAANGGNWIITPAGELRLVPLVSAAGAASATTNVIDVTGVTGAVMVYSAAAVTGIRYQTDGEPVVLGDETGIVIEADVGAAIASDLYDDLIGMTYQAYSLNGAIYDPAAELGDFVRGGANGEVSGVLYAEAAVLAMAFRGDISAPESGEMADEYPYIGASEKALTAAKVFAAQQVAALDGSLDQTSVFNRLTGNGAAQGLYMVNGQLYVNMSYARSGTLILGGLNNQDGTLEVHDANDNIIVVLDNTGADITDGSVTTYSSDRQIRALLSDGSLVFQVYEGAVQPIGWNNTLAINSDGTIQARTGRVYLLNKNYGGAADTDWSSVDIYKDFNGTSHIRLITRTLNAASGIRVDYDGISFSFSDADGTTDYTIAKEVSNNPLSIGNGGTGANTAAGALAALGGVSSSDTIDIAHGGTGETTAAGALAALGAYSNANAASNVSLFNTTTDVVSNSSVSLTPTENPRNFKMLVFNCTTSSSNSGGTRGQLLFPVVNPNDARHFALQCGSTLGYIRVQIQNNSNDIVVLTTGGFDHLYVTGIYGMFRIANN